MGREVRRVPKHWQHPRQDNGQYRPMRAGGYERAAKRWTESLSRVGLQATIDDLGAPPERDGYMPDWIEAEATHLMMYEDTSEGTPISPAFESAEELARWLADNKASAFGGMTATYEQWLAMAQRGWAPGAVFASGEMISGVAATKSE